MSLKTAAYIGVIVGSAVGSYIPLLWGDSLFSFSSIILTAVGGGIGIYIAFKLNN